MPNIRLTLEYDGSAYHGWQRQANVPTIQHTLERAVARISGDSVTVIGAGRTDAGVHALAQTANFQTKPGLDPEAWRRALNAVLPADIAVTASQSAAETFHARFAARGKRYRYVILNRSSPSPLLRRFAWHVIRPLRTARMRKAATHLLGTRDFRAFCAADPTHAPSDNFMCTLTECRLSISDDLLTIEIEGDRFLKYMMRNIVGTLVEIGLTKRTPDAIPGLLASGDRRLAGPTAPPHGLTLMAVRYGGL